MLHPATRPLGALLLLLAVTSASCKRGSSAAPVDAGPSRTPSEPVVISVTDARTDLVFSYQDEQGKFHDTQHIAEIPEAARKHVLVRDLSLNPEEVHADEFLYVADLTQHEDGGYPYALVSRYRFHLPDPADVEMDDGGVEKDSIAAEALARKMKRAGVSYRGVPVIDVRGHLMEGFDPRAVEQALHSGS